MDDDDGAFVGKETELIQLYSNNHVDASIDPFRFPPHLQARSIEDHRRRWSSFEECRQGTRCRCR